MKNTECCQNELFQVIFAIILFLMGILLNMKSSFSKKQKRYTSHQESYLNYTQILLEEIQDNKIKWVECTVHTY